MATRRQLLFLAGGAALWVGGIRVVPNVLSRFSGFEFTPSNRVPGFGVLGSAGNRSALGGEFDVMVGLEPVDPLPSDVYAQVEAAPTKALFGGIEGGGPPRVAYVFDYYCPYCRVLSEELTELASTSEIALVRHHWPIFGAPSELAARAVLAAERQGDAEVLHRRLLRTPVRVTPPYLEELVADVGLSWAGISRNLHAPSVTAALDRTEALARLFAFVGTPSLVIERTIVRSSMPKYRLRDLLRLERNMLSPGAV